MSAFKIIEGLPEHVELDVNRYLSSGWELNGELFHRTVDGNNIAVQSIRRDDNAVSDKAIYVFLLTTTSTFDPHAMIHVLYHKQLPTKDGFRYTFTYVVKILSSSVEKAEATIQNELQLQLGDAGFDGQIEFIQQEDYNV